MATMPFEVIAGPGTWQSVSEAKREAYVPLGAPALRREPGRERHLWPGQSAEDKLCDRNRANDYLTVTRPRLSLKKPLSHGILKKGMTHKT